MAKENASSEFYDLMQEVLRTYHPNLLSVMDQIGILIREKAAKAGGKPVLGKARKASEDIAALTGSEYKFILEIAGDEWLNLSSRQRKALMDSLLCSLVAEDDPETGATKCSIIPPDVSYYYGELERWGDWKPRADDKPESPLQEIFGKNARSVVGSEEEGADDVEN